MSGELLVLAFGFGFDHVIGSVDKLPEHTFLEKALRLAPVSVILVMTWAMNSVSLYIDSRLLWYHLILGCLACFFSNLFSAYFFITTEKGWPNTIVTVSLENIFTGLLLYSICVHGYYMRFCDLTELPLVQATFSSHLVCVIILMFCRSWFRSDWKVVQKRVWIPNFLFETIDIVSVYVLYESSDVDEYWYMWFLFGEFCFNLIIFEVGQNFWKSDYAVGAHVFIFDLVSDIPLILVVLYRITSSGHNVLADEVHGFPVQAFSFVVNVLILIKSVLAQPIWWWLQDDEDEHTDVESAQSIIPHTTKDPEGEVILPQSRRSNMILIGVQIVKLCFIMIGLPLAIMSLQYPVIMASTLVVREMLPPEFTQIRNVRLFKSS